MEIVTKGRKKPLRNLWCRRRWEVRKWTARYQWGVRENQFEKLTQFPPENVVCFCQKKGPNKPASLASGKAMMKSKKFRRSWK